MNTHDTDSTPQLPDGSVPSAPSSEGSLASPPVILNTTLYVLTVIALVLSMFTVVGIPFAVAAFFYVAKARGEAVKISQESREASLLAKRQKELLEQMGAMDIHQRQEHLKGLEGQLQERNAGLQRLQAQSRAYGQEVELLKAQILDLQANVEINDFGLYNFENPAQDSIRVGEDLRRVQAEIKAAVASKNAAAGSTSFTLNNSAAKGQKMVNDMTKLLLRAFNAEAENCVKTVKAGRLSTARTRLQKSAQAVARLGKSMDIQIQPSYLWLRERELELTHEHLEALKAQKEEERAERERQRDEAQAKREFEQAKAKQLKEVTQFEAALRQLRAAGDLEGAAQIESQLVAAQELLEDLEERMTHTRAGHVYVISNIGAFGEGMVKIGMTRRLNPEDRIRELGDASVPFLFDQHAMIFSPDAVGLEAQLHRYFADRRVNLVNMRREYFYATPHEVKTALLELGDAHVLEFHEEWIAPEFSQSQVLRKSQGLPSVPTKSLAGLMSDLR